MVPLASARVADVIPVELVVVERPPQVVEAPPAPPAPPKRVTPPKPLAMPLPKMVEERLPPPPAAAPEPLPAPVAPAAAAPSAPAASATSVDLPRTSTSAPARADDSGVSLIENSASSAPAVASIPLARPTGGYQVRPSYPSSARRLGVQGTTMLRVHVLDDGRVGDVDVEQSAGHPDLDQAAADAVRRWRFDPARRGEQAVAMWVRLPVEFRLK